ncbi:MAG: hypothetical protein HOP36_05875 [Methyloglobulus sp.]|nr:hypothetical protein [Methyloglobulus sp.]
MLDYRRYRIPGGTYFFTVNLLEMRPNDLLTRHIDILRQAVKESRKRWPFYINAWVVLPDHLHMMLALPANYAGLGARILGVVALVWTLDCFVSFYLTLPVRRRVRTTR